MIRAFPYLSVVSRCHNTLLDDSLIRSCMPMFGHAMGILLEVFAVTGCSLLSRVALRCRHLDNRRKVKSETTIPRGKSKRRTLRSYTMHTLVRPGPAHHTSNAPDAPIERGRTCANVDRLGATGVARQAQAAMRSGTLGVEKDPPPEPAVIADSLGVHWTAPEVCFGM